MKGEQPVVKGVACTVCSYIDLTEQIKRQKCINPVINCIYQKMIVCTPPRDLLFEIQKSMCEQDIACFGGP